MKLNSKILILTLLGLAVYFNSLFNSFVWDDEEQIILNSLVHSITNIFSFFAGSTFNTGGAGVLGGLYYKPMMTTVFALLYALFGPNPFFFHLFQVGIHITNSILVYLIFTNFFKKAGWVPFFLAAVFLVHPINAEAVAYIASLQDVLFFFFGAMAFYLVLQEKQGFFRYLLISSLLLLSFLSKETGLLFPIVIGFYLILFKKKLWPFILATGASFSIYAILRFAIAGIYFNKHSLTLISTIPLSGRMINIPQIFVFYFKTFIFPDNLLIDQQWAIQAISWNDFWLPFIYVIFIVAVILTLGFTLWKKKDPYFKLFIFFFFWFLISLGLHLQFFPLDLTVAERWFYMPMIGLLGMAGTVFKRTNTPIIIMLILLISVLSIRTIIRNSNWQNGLTLYSHDIQISKPNFDLENNVGVELYRTGQVADAKKHFENSTILAPYWWTNWNNLGAMIEAEGNLPKAEEYYRKSIANGNYYLAFENLARILLKQEKFEEARNFAKDSLLRLPNNPILQSVLATAEQKL